MKRLLFLIYLLVGSSVAMAEDYSMRRCMLLPITDTAGNSLGYKVYEEAERYLKDRGWCNYISSSEVIEIFSKYRERLAEHMSDPNVIRTVANRLKVGTLIRVKLKYDIDMVEVSLDVLGENGSDTYFSEKAIIQKSELNQITTTIFNWLDLYETTIPYHGKVAGVLGDQVTITFPKNKLVRVGQEFIVKKLVRKKKHPLLKKIVEWESRKIAVGKIYNLSRGQALGLIKEKYNDDSIIVGDWIRLEKDLPTRDKSKKNYSKYDEHKFGRLGELSLSLNLSSHNTKTSAITGSNKYGNFIYGISAEAEAWITREYFVLGEFTKRLGSLESSSGTPASSEADISVGVFKLGGGYKYLPMGYFYGPQVNFSAGYASYSYELDKSPTDGLGTNNFSGLFLGVGGSIPFQKDIRIYGGGEIMPFPDFEDDSGIYGSKKRISSVAFELGVHYQYTSLIKLIGAFEVVNNTAKLSGNNSELSYRDTTLKVGGVFTF